MCFSVLGRAFEHVTDEIKIDVEKEGFDSNSKFFYLTLVRQLLIEK